jgi:hypothetical protein
MDALSSSGSKDTSGDLAGAGVEGNNIVKDEEKV